MKKHIIRLNESWDPDYDGKSVNQWGEKWQLITGTYLNSTIDDIIKDVQIDPYQDGPKLESLSQGSLHICEDGHLIAEIYGGANGGGFRGSETNWPFYFSLVRKFLGKILDCNNGEMFKDVWLIDWDNDCCDDVWTLRLGLELSDKEKLSLVECGKKFSVVDPTKLDVSLDAAVEMVDPLANDAIQVANCAATVAESRKKTLKNHWTKINESGVKNIWKQVYDKLDASRQKLGTAINLLNEMGVSEDDWVWSHINSHYNDIDDTMDIVVSRI